MNAKVRTTVRLAGSHTLRVHNVLQAYVVHVQVVGPNILWLSFLVKATDRCRVKKMKSSGSTTNPLPERRPCSEALRKHDHPKHFRQVITFPSTFG